jgi:hypothetical protein
MQTNQKSDIDKVKSAIVILRKNLNESWLYYCIATELHSQYFSKKPFNIKSLFSGSVDACIRTSLITLAELLSRSDDSTNLCYLLNLANNSPKLFRHVQKKELQNAVEKYCEWLNSLEGNGFSKNLFIKRDKTLAHTDRKYVIEKASGFIKNYPPLVPDEVRKVYLGINQLLSDFEKYFFGRPARIGFIDVEPEIRNEIKQIMEKELKQ